MWLQCKEKVFSELVQKALILDYVVKLTPKFKLDKVQVFGDDSTGIIKKTYVKSAGYVELGKNDWYLVKLDPTISSTLIDGMDLGPYILANSAKLERIVHKVSYEEEHLYFRVYDEDPALVHSFTQHLIIKRP